MMAMKILRFFVQVPLGRYLMMFTDGDTTTFHFLAPQKGTYLLVLMLHNYFFSGLKHQGRLL
jgi:hypothetical protein